MVPQDRGRTNRTLLATGLQHLHFNYRCLSHICRTYTGCVGRMVYGCLTIFHHHYTDMQISYLAMDALCICFSALAYTRSYDDAVPLLFVTVMLSAHIFQQWSDHVALNVIRHEKLGVSHTHHVLVV